MAVEVVVLPEDLGQVGQEIVLQLLVGVGVHVGQGHVLGQRLVHGGHDGANTPSLLGRVVVGVVGDGRYTISSFSFPGVELKLLG